MKRPLQSIGDLLQEVEALRDDVGCLAAIAPVLAPWGPSMLLVADADGNLLAASDLGAATGIAAAPDLARQLAEGLRADDFCARQVAAEEGPRMAFAVRIGQAGDPGLLGGLVLASQGAAEQLRQLRPTLAACGKLAGMGIRTHRQARKLVAESRQLRTEHTTLKAAHTQAVIDAVKEREERFALEAHQLALEQFLDAAEKANRSKSEFLAGMSHEIRTPMTAILGFADLLLDSLEEPDEMSAAATIKRNGQYLLELINDILDVAKIEAGKLEVQRVPCSPHEIVAEVVSLLTIRAAAKGLRLEARFEGAIPETIVTDPRRTRQILINLVGNAIKFTEQGEVRVRTSLVEPDGEQPRLRFDVIDTGIGMTAEQLEGLFSPFHQAGAASRRKYEGTGLGLVITKRLVEMLGGEVAVRSVPGKGTTFTATVATGPLDGVQTGGAGPEKAAQPVPQARKTPPLGVPGDCRILLVEDTPDNQRLISFLLDRAGAEVTVAPNGLAALKEIEAGLAPARSEHGDGAGPFDLVLMDIDMPVMNGLEATRRIRQAGYTGPIVALTAHAMGHHVRETLAAGCDCHVSKPIDRGKLLEAILRCLTMREEDPVSL